MCRVPPSPTRATTAHARKPKLCLMFWARTKITLSYITYMSPARLFCKFATTLPPQAHAGSTSLCVPQKDRRRHTPSQLRPATAHTESARRSRRAPSPTPTRSPQSAPPRPPSTFLHAPCSTVREEDIATAVTCASLAVHDQIRSLGATCEALGAIPLLDRRHRRLRDHLCQG